MTSKARNLADFISTPTISTAEIADTAVTHAKLHTDMNLSGKTLTFATNQISGNAIDGGVISNFASTGIDDNSSATAVTILSDGKVGLGVTSPIRQLHLASSVPSIRLEDTDVSGAYNDIVHLSTGELSIRVDHGNVQSNSSLSFLIDADEKMRIDTSGNVGIGLTANIASKLHVNSELSLGPDNNNRMIVGSTSVGVGSIGTIEGGTASFSTMTFKGGKVGIGNTAPEDYFAGAANLVIGSNNGTDNGITIVAPTNKLGRIHFADGTTGSDEYAGFIAYAHATDELKFGAGADGGTDLTIKAGIVYAHQYNRGTPTSSAPFGTIIIHDNQMANANKSISNTQTSWSDGATKVVTPQSANSYFWVELYHNEHINTTTPNYGGGIRLIGDDGSSVEIARGGEMIYVTNGAYSSSYNGNAKVWGGWYNPATASNITFRVQVTGTSSQSGNNYYWHWASNYIANQPGPRLRIVEFT